MSIRGRILWIALFVTLACDRPTPSRANDTADHPAPPPPAKGRSVVANSQWNAELGPAFLVSSAAAEQGAVVLPAFDSSAALDTGSVDVRTVQSKRFALFANGQYLGSATAGPTVDTEVPAECTSWPIVRLESLSEPASRGWVVGVESDRIVPFAMDSLSSLGAADSARLTIDVARLASAAPGDTVPALRGTPFQVRRAYRLTSEPGSVFVFAEVLRSLNQEATPLQEHLLVIAVRDTTTGRLEVVYSERTAGSEETMEATELLLAGQIVARGTRFALVARYVADGVIYSLIEGAQVGPWRNRWTSTYSGC